MEELYNFKYKDKNYIVPIANPSFTNNIDSFNKRNIVKYWEPVNFLTINITDNCNFNCKYCFASDRSATKIADREENFMKSIDMLLKSGSKEKTIRFIGGEPLIEFNLIRRLVNYVKSRNIEKDIVINFSIATNGSLLNEDIITFLKEHSFHILYSIDGDSNIHGRQRPDQKGANTFNIVSKNAKSVVDDYKLKTIARAVLDPNISFEEFKNSIDEILNLGFRFVSFDVPWIDKDSDFSLDKKSITNVIDLWSKVADIFLEKLLERDLSWIGLTPLAKKFSILLNENSDLFEASCGAGTEMIAVNYDGNYYPCHSFVGNKEFQLGNVEENPNFNNGFENYFSSELETCNTCWNRYICLSRCPYDSYMQTGSIYERNNFRCLLDQHLTKLAIYIYTEIKEKDPSIIKLLKRVVRTEATLAV